MNPIDFLTDLFNPELAFLPKALAVAVMSSVVCGVVGTYVVLRGMAFIGDAVAHAVFPGLAIAFVVSGNLVLGGTIAGVITAILVAVFSQNRRLKEDSIIGILFVAAFALGIVIISQAPGYAGSLQQFLFGSITGIPDSDLYVVGVTGLVVLAALFAFHKEFVAISLDRESARAMGVRVFWLDLVLYVLITLAVVISVQTIGNVLVLALLITPAATARLLTERLGVMMALAPTIGGVSALLGLYISWSWALPTGGTIVLVLTAAFLLAWFLSPRQGVLARAIARLRHRNEAAARRRRWVMPAVTGVLALLGAGSLAAALALSGGAAAAPDTAVAAASPSPAASIPPVIPGVAEDTDDDQPVAERADPAWVSDVAGATKIPERALAAYAGTSLAVAETHPTCGIGWNTLAAIGEVESGHGTIGGSQIGSDGVAAPDIIGVALDGDGVQTIRDTDNGRLDGDTRWDRAVGPMQFIPTTWADHAQDGNGDGAEDVHQIDDAALAAAVYLCESGGDLTVAENWITAVAAYNPDVDYNNRVAEAADRYADRA